MKLSDNVEVNVIPYQSKYPINIIYDLLNTTVCDIRSNNDELRSIRDRTIQLETRNDSLIDRLRSIVAVIDQLGSKDVSVQSEAVDLCDIGVDARIVSSLDVAIETESTEEVTPPVVITETSAAVAVVAMEIEEVAFIKEKEEIPKEPQYSKEDMLFYLARYKIKFLTFVQCHKDDIEHSSGGFDRELIRSFSRGERRRDGNSRRRDRDRDRERERRSEKPGVVETVAGAADDEGLRCSLYGDLDYQDVLNSAAAAVPINSGAAAAAVAGSVALVPENKAKAAPTEVHKETPKVPVLLPQSIKFDLSNPDSPLFPMRDSRTASIAAVATAPVAIKTPIPSPPKKAKAIEAPPAERHRHRHDEPKRKHSSRKKEKDLEEGEIV